MVGDRAMRSYPCSAAGSTGQWLQCPPGTAHPTATPLSIFWDSFRKFPHHRRRGNFTPVKSQGTGEPKHHHTHHTLQLGVVLPPTPEWAEISCAPPAQAPPPSQRRKQCPEGLHSAIWQEAIHNRKIHSTATSLPSPPEYPYPQVMTPTTDHFFLQMTLYFKPIPQLNDPT